MTRRNKFTALSLIAATALIATPVSPAFAEGFHHHHGGNGFHRGGEGFHHAGNGLLFGLIGAGAAVTIAAATLATAPFQIAADVPPAPVYGYGAPAYYPAPAPQQVYAYPTTVYPSYGYAAYRYPRRTVVYGYPQPVYVYPAPY